MREISKMVNLMEEELNIMEEDKWWAMQTNKMLLIRHLLECKRTTGKSMKEILEKIKGMDKE